MYIIYLEANCFGTDYEILYIFFLRHDEGRGAIR